MNKDYPFWISLTRVSIYQHSYPVHPIPPVQRQVKILFRCWKAITQGFKTAKSKFIFPSHLHLKTPYCLSKWLCCFYNSVFDTESVLLLAWEKATWLKSHDNVEREGGNVESLCYLSDHNSEGVSFNLI